MGKKLYKYKAVSARSYLRASILSYFRLTRLLNVNNEEAYDMLNALYNLISAQSQTKKIRKYRQWHNHI